MVQTIIDGNECGGGKLWANKKVASHLTVGSSGDGVGAGVTGCLVGDNVAGSKLG